MEYPNWFAQAAQANFEAHFPTDRPVQVLQIGAYVGHASEWICEHMADGSTLTDVDTWKGTANEEVHGTFDWGDVWETYRHRVRGYDDLLVVVQTSDRFFAENPEDRFDVIYIDGSHEREQVYRDALHAHEALLPGGLLIFDDYVWNAPDPTNAPRPAIDQFFAEHHDDYHVVAINNQVWLQRRDERKPMRVAVYAIAKDEEQFVERWAESAEDADYRMILDTGSTDGTVEAARRLGIDTAVQAFDPWRFDVARNRALDLLPKDVDYCIALDLDEVLIPGWREELEKAHAEGWTRPRYRYTWSWTAEGAPGLVYGGDKIHTRDHYRWKHPVHEVCLRDDGRETQGWTGLEIHHHPDPTKSRSSYAPLLEQAVAEDPEDDRNAFYLGREYCYAGRTAEAAVMLKRYLSLPRAVWHAERSRAMIYLSTIEDARTWLLRAAAEAPGRREPWVALAQHFYEAADWVGCLWAAQQAQKIVEKPLDYLCEDWAWNDRPWDLGAIAAHHLGLYDEAVRQGEVALSIDPDDPRLVNNLGFYKEAVDEAKTR